MISLGLMLNLSMPVVLAMGTSAASPVQFRCRWKNSDETPECTMAYSDKNNLKKHIKESHIQGNAPFVCKFPRANNGLCNNARSQSAGKLVVHIMDAHVSRQEEKKDCPFCSKKWSGFAHIKEKHSDKYITISDNNRHWTCTYPNCDEEGGTVKPLIAHIKSHENADARGSSKCKWSGCSDFFMDNGLLFQHLLKDHVKIGKDIEQSQFIKCCFLKSDGTECGVKVGKSLIANHIQSYHINEHCPCCQSVEGYLNVKCSIGHFIEKHDLQESRNSDQTVRYRCSGDNATFSHKENDVLGRIACFYAIKKHFAGHSLNREFYQSLKSTETIKEIAFLQCLWQGCSCNSEERFRDSVEAADHIYGKNVLHLLEESKISQVTCSLIMNDGSLCGQKVDTLKIKEHLRLHYKNEAAEQLLQLKCPYPNCEGADFQKAHIIKKHADDFLTLGSNSLDIVKNFPRIICKKCGVLNFFKSLQEVHSHIIKHQEDPDYRGTVFTCSWDNCGQEFNDREEAKRHLQEHAATSNFCQMRMSHCTFDGTDSKEQGTVCGEALDENNPWRHLRGHSRFLKGSSSVCLLCPYYLKAVVIGQLVSNKHIRNNHSNIILASDVEGGNYHEVNFSCQMCNEQLGDGSWSVMAHILEFHQDLIRCDEIQRRILREGDQLVPDHVEDFSDDEELFEEDFLVPGLAQGEKDSDSEEPLEMNVPSIQTVRCLKCSEGFTGVGEDVEVALEDHMREEHPQKRKRKKHRVIESDDEVEENFETMRSKEEVKSFVEGENFVGNSEENHRLIQKIWYGKKECPYFCANFDNYLGTFIEHLKRDDHPLFNEHGYCFVSGCITNGRFSSKFKNIDDQIMQLSKHIKQLHPDYCYICFKKHSGNLKNHILYRHPGESVEEPLDCAGAAEQGVPKKKISFREYLEQKKRDKDDRESKK